MNKGLDLIQRQQIEAIDGCPTGNVYVGLTFEELAELEKELKALTIIKEKGIILQFIKETYTVEQYNAGVFGTLVKPLTQEEYEILKEVLLWSNIK